MLKIRATVFLALLTVILSGCNDQFTLTCSQIQENQRASFMEPLASFPAGVVADFSFSDDEYAAIQSAAADWNTLGQQLIGSDFFTVSSDVVPDDVVNADPRACSSSTQAQSQFYIVRDTSAAHWQSLGFDPATMGVTLRCQSTSQVLKQIILINPSNFDPNQVNPTQMKSVALHELGHSLGLDHSCSSGAGGQNFVACTGLALDDPYHIAVMFPWLGSGISQPTTAGQTTVSTNSQAPSIKETLQQNDVQRASCLY